MNKSDIEDDIDFIKRKLISQHYDLNWEGRKAQIFSALDSLAINSNKLTVKAFNNSLKTIVGSIDDGHTTVREEVEMDLVRSNSGKPFECYMLEKNTAYLKVPHFQQYEGLSEALSTFQHLVEKHKKLATGLGLVRNIALRLYGEVENGMVTKGV